MRIKHLAILWLATVLLGVHAPLRADLVSHWKLDGDFGDSGPSGNDGLFIGEDFPFFTEDVNGNEESALSLDGVDDFVEIQLNAGLPIYSSPAYSVAMWVKGLPQTDNRVYSEASSAENNSLFNIGTQNTGVTGQVDIFIRTSTGVLVRAHVLSTGIAFDGSWHHIAWVDDAGQAALYIDGVRDATDFSYAKPDLALDYVTLGAVVRPSRAPPACCLFQGEIDDVRVYDHALTEEEVQALFVVDCPESGEPEFEDTHCLDLFVVPPAAGAGTPGIYTVSVDADDVTGDDIRYSFRAESDGGVVLMQGPQSDPSADFDLDQGTWTISATVDDNPLCGDDANDVTCTAEAIAIVCPAAGDTHCGALDIIAPLTGGPGLYSVSVIGAFDDSGEPILYTFTADDGEGTVLRVGPTLDPFADFNIATTGAWTFEALVDDDPDCDDDAPDNLCTELVDVSCPDTGDTHCDDMIIEGPDDGGPGTYVVTVQGAFDEGLELFQYTFVAESDAGRTIQFGPQDADFALLTLGAGNWTIRVTVDDDPLCDDEAGDAVCSDVVEVVGGPPRMISRWTFDGGTEDSEDSGNDGVFESRVDFDPDPNFMEGFDGTQSGAILFDGVDDFINVQQESNLPLYAHEAFSIAMWVNGGPQPDYRVWSEGSTFDNAPLFNIGTQNTGDTGQVDIFIRGGAGVGTVVGHRYSDQIAFDNSWHHIAWVDDDGQAILYIDGIRDATNFNYSRPPLGLNTTTIGGILRAADSHWFIGAIDDVRVYNYALGEDEVIALVPEPEDCSRSGDTHCDDLVVEGPEGDFEGDYLVTVSGAFDDTGDAIIYIFTAVDQDGEYLQSGPQSENSALFDLSEGTWTISVKVDDDLLCRTSAGDAACSQDVTVVREPERLISHWKLDGDLDDSQEAANHGAFLGGEPVFVADRDGNPGAALSLDGVDDYVEILPQPPDLPIYRKRRYSVAMWVRGLPQPDNRVYSEESSVENSSLFNIGTQFQGVTGQVDIYIRSATGATAYPGNGHHLSTGIAFDGAWHHIAWTDDEGEAALYIDGVRDATDYSYAKAGLDLDLTHLGAVVRPSRAPPPCCLFQGDIDDVRVYNYALGEDEVSELAGRELPGELFVRGDSDASGRINLTDGISILNWLFLGGPEPVCLDAADTDDTGTVNLTDAVRVFNWLFTGGPAPLAPGPTSAEYLSEDCGVDETPDRDNLECAAVAAKCE